MIDRIKFELNEITNNGKNIKNIFTNNYYINDMMQDREIARANKRMIKTLKLFGERHSGTNAVALFIVRNFRLSYKAFDLGWKHRLAPNPREYENRTESTLFAFSFRNPYSWIKSMHRHSYEEHKMAGYLKKLSFDDFLRYPFIDYENIITTWNIKNNSYINMARRSSILNKNKYRKFSIKSKANT